jgi:hypothetical protein
MNRTELIREILSENDNLNSKQIMDILIQKYPQIWENKVAFYAEAGKEKSESWVKRQLTAEVGRTLLTWVTEGKVIKVVNGNGILNTFIATDNFKKQFTNDVSFEAENFNIYDDEVDEDLDCVNCDDKVGIVYFLQSDIFSDVSKIGKTTDLDKRIYDLSKDNRYGVFNLKVNGWIRVRNYGSVEKMFHNFFNKYRLYKGNFNLKVDTELFKTNDNLYEMWVSFIKVNYLNNPLMKDEIVDYHF